MSADLDHTIVHVRDRHAAAAHVVEMLNLDPPVEYGPFAMVRLGNQAVLAFADTLGRPRHGHFAFLVDPAEFEQIRATLGRPRHHHVRRARPPARGRRRGTGRGRPRALLGRPGWQRPRDPHRARWRLADRTPTPAGIRSRQPGDCTGSLETSDNDGDGRGFGLGPPDRDAPDGAVHSPPLTRAAQAESGPPMPRTVRGVDRPESVQSCPDPGSGRTSRQE